MRFLSFAFAFISLSALAESPRVQEGPRVDVIRELEAGESHLALRCTKGVNADSVVKCQIQRKEGKSPIVRIEIPLERAQKIADTFLSRLSPEDVKSQGGVFKKNPTGFVHYYVLHSDKYAQGSLSHDPQLRTPASERNERAVLALEESLFNLFQLEKLKKK